MISFIARSAVAVVVGYIADRIGLQAAYFQINPSTAAKRHRDGCVLDPDLIRCGN